MSLQKTTLEEEWLPEANPWLITLAVMLATFIVVLDSSIANVALPHMAGSFSSSSHEATWILTSYLIASGIILPSTAWFSGIFGRKKFLLICTIVFTVASFLCGLSTSLNMMILARILQGLGGGALMPISQAIMLESFPACKRAMSMSIFGFGVVFAPIIGPTLGGWITDNLSWHWIFFINIPIGIIAIILSYIFIEDPPYLEVGKINKIDFIGFASLIIWLVTLQVVLDNGQNADWFGSEWVCWTSAVSVVAMIVFFAWELYFKDSIIDLSVFLDRNFTIGTILYTMLCAILYSTLAILPLFLQNLLDYSAFNSGLAIAPRGVGSLVAIGLSGYLANKIDTRILIAFGFVLMTIAGFLFGELNLNTSMINFLVPNIICGLSFGFLFTPLTIVSFTTLSKAQMGNATGLYNLMRNIGGAIGTSVVSTLLMRYSQVHQEYLVKNLNNLSPVFNHHLAYISSYLNIHMDQVTALHKANYLLYSQLIKQATLFSYIDNFRLYAIISLILAPCAFLFKRAKHHKKKAT